MQMCLLKSSSHNLHQGVAPPRASMEYYFRQQINWSLCKLMTTPQQKTKQIINKLSNMANIHT